MAGVRGFALVCLWPGLNDGIAGLVRGLTDRYRVRRVVGIRDRRPRPADLRRHVDPHGDRWTAVLESTGQPVRLRHGGAGRAGAHRAGALLAAGRTSDVVDATVVDAALARHAVIVTSDRSDVERLLGGAAVPIVDV